MNSAPAAQPALPGVFFQTHAPGAPAKLDILAREVGPREFHFYAAGIEFADLAPILEPELKGTQALIFRMPHALLNPNYWERHTKAGEDEERARGAELITRDDQGATWLWRSHAIAPGRYLLDGLDVPVERVRGAAFKIAGPDIIKLGNAWTNAGPDPADRFEWLAFAPGTSVPTDSQDDLEAFRLRTPGATMLFAATGDPKVRIAFSNRKPFRECACGALRGYMIRCAGRTVSKPNEHVCDGFLAHAGRGLTSSQNTDFRSKGTAFEFTAKPGISPWSKGWIGDEPTTEDHILVYYDRVAGIWAVAF